jgi:hypothetical protein
MQVYIQANMDTILHSTAANTTSSQLYSYHTRVRWATLRNGMGRLEVADGETASNIE